MTNELMIADSTTMLTSSNVDAVELDVMELSEDDLDAVAGGCGCSFGDGFNQSSGNFYSKKNFAMNQATFAGPEGSGTISSINLEEINSGAFQNISAGL